MAFQEDLSVFFADFGVDGTLDGAAVRVIFDAPAVGEGMAGLAMSAVAPQVQLRTSDVPAEVYGKTLVLPQGTFTVNEHVPDGTGMSTLLLQRVS